MKNILVLTDFSENAGSAEEYALRLAIQVKANLILYNNYPIYGTPISEAVVWPHDSTPSLELESISNLQSKVDELNDELAKIHQPIYKPTITHMGDPGFLEKEIMDIVTENNIWLVVMGTRGEGLANNLILGSNVCKILDNINCPVLIVPRNAKCKNLHKLAYATDLRDIDLSNIAWLKNFAEDLELSLNIIHVSIDNVSPQDNMIKKMRQQMLKMNNNINVQFFEGKSVKESLHQIIEQMNVDILALMHRKYGFFDALFHKSISHRMIRHSQIPVLVFPG